MRKRLCLMQDLKPGKPTVILSDGNKVAVMKTADGAVIAFSPFCPHARANLLHGRFENDTVTCHWHGWTFDLRSGEGTNNDSCLHMFPVVEEAGVVYLVAENRDVEQPGEDFFMPEIKWKKDSND